MEAIQPLSLEEHSWQTRSSLLCEFDEDFDDIHPESGPWDVRLLDAIWISQGKLKAPLLTLYGILSTGHSASIQVSDVMPFISFKLPDDWSSSYIETMMRALEEKLIDYIGDGYKPKEKIIVWNMRYAENLMGFQGGRVSSFVYLHLNINPRYMRHVQALLEYPYGTDLMEGASKEFQEWPQDVPLPVPSWWPSFLPETRLEIFNASLEPLLAIWGVKHIPPSGWVRVQNGRIGRLTDGDLCQTSIVTTWGDVRPSPLPPTKLPSIVTMTYDIETEVGEDGRFPQSDEQAVLQISIRWEVFKGTSTTSKSLLLVTGSVYPPKDAEVMAFHDECDLLSGFIKVIQKADPDILYGYNTSGFDNKFLMDRMTYHDLTSEEFTWGRCPTRATHIYQKVFMSSAHQTQTWALSLPGRVHIDVMECVKRDYKLRSYSLEAVSQRFLKKHKVDLDHRQINVLQQTLEGRSTLAAYAQVDAELTLGIAHATRILVNVLQMAYVAHVFPQQLMTRGQQLRYMSQLWHFCLKQDPQLFIPTPPLLRPVDDSTYQGANVFEPKRGFYPGTILGQDFASLYPSIMIAMNLCYSTYIDPARFPHLKETAWNEPSDGDYYRVPNFELDEHGDVVALYESKNPCFVFPHVRKGILPMILENLLKERKKVRKDMELLKDEALYAIFNGLQLALKMMANSIYGATGASTGKLCLKAIAETVTRFGRGFIMMTKAHVEKHFNRGTGWPADSRVVYGDSVTEDTPIPVLHEDKFSLTPIKNIHLLTPGNSWKEIHGGKEAYELKNVQVWTERGWTLIERVIRHALPKQKRIFAILTNTGYVEVTEDHSLLDPNGNCLKPTEVVLGTDLLHNDINFTTLSTTGPVLNFSYEDGQKYKIPKYMPQAQRTAATLFISARQMGHYVKLDLTEHAYELTIMKNAPAHATAIKKIEEIEYSGQFVYDLTTANHHFAAGVGSLVVHNTDSVYVHLDGFPKEAPIEEVIKMGMAMEASVTKVFPAPVRLEFEKIYHPLLLVTKKRYAGRKLEVEHGAPSSKGWKLDVMGMESVRRDFCSLVSDTVRDSLRLLVQENQPENALRFASETITNLLLGKVNASRLVISRQISRHVNEYKTRAPHIELAKKWIETPGSPPVRIGDRIPYIIINKGPKQAVYQCAESPWDVMENHLPIDYAWYLNKQLEQPLRRIFYWVIKFLDERNGTPTCTDNLTLRKFVNDPPPEDNDSDHEEDEQEVEDLYQEAKNTTSKKYVKWTVITHKNATTKLAPKNHSALLIKDKRTGQALLQSNQRKTRVPVQGVWASFLKVKNRCNICRGVVDNANAALCSHCQKTKSVQEKTNLKEKHLTEYKDAEKEVNRCLEICRTCVAQTPGLDLEGCRNWECQNLFDRHAARTRLQDVQKLCQLDW